MKSVTGDRIANLLHCADDKAFIMNTSESTGEDFFGFEEVLDVRSGVVCASVAVAL